jgi:hypothetical protein
MAANMVWGDSGATEAPYRVIMTLDLTGDEAAALARCLRHVIEDDRFPLAPRLEPLKAILGKLDPPKPQPEPLPPLPAGGGVGRAICPAVTR